MTAQDDIRAAAHAHGWTVDTSDSWHDWFVRPVDPATLPEVLARFFAVTDHTPADLVIACYDSLGRVTAASTATPGQQSAISGVHVGPDDIVGPDKARRVLSFLADGVTCVQAVGLVQ